MYKDIIDTIGYVESYDPELCREDTVVAGYSALREEDVERVAQALARAWLCAPRDG